MVARDDPDYFRRLLSLDDIDQILTTRTGCYPDIFLTNAEREIKAAEYTGRGDEIDPVRLYQLHASGATIVLNHLNTSHAPLAELCAALEAEFSAPFQANIYLTPPRARGFKAHFDTHDVFILQVHGSKRWRLYGTPIALPLSGQGSEAVQEEPGLPVTEFELNAGDTLYIPRGLVHDAPSLDSTSMHITVGILSYTWTDLMLESLADAVLEDPAFRRSLPPGMAQPGFDRTAARATFRKLLDLFAQSANADAALDAFAGEFINTRRPRLRGQMRQIASIADINVDSFVGRHDYLAYSLQEDQTALRLRCYGNEISFPPAAAAGVRFALTAQRFRVGELPGELDDAGKLVLVRRLVREGILAVVTAQ